MFIQLMPEFGQLNSASSGVCYICNVDRQPKAEGVVSTGHFIEAEGLLELCKACVLEMAALFGVVEGDRALRLGDTNRRLGMQLKASLATQDAQGKTITALAEQLSDLIELARG